MTLSIHTNHKERQGDEESSYRRNFACGVFFCQLCYNMYDDDFGEYCLNEGITSRLITIRDTLAVMNTDFKSKNWAIYFSNFKFKSFQK